MHIISVSTLKAFYLQEPRAEQPIKLWVAITKAARWQTPIEVKGSFPAADIRPQSRIVFDIGSNKFRLVAKIEYRIARVYIRFIGTHIEYNRINVDTV